MKAPEPNGFDAILRSHAPQAIYPAIYRGTAMSNAAQRRALDKYRSRLTERGMARFEVMAMAADRELIRTLARRLAEESSEAAQIRATVQRAIAGEPEKGGILDALRRSPLVGADLDLARPREKGRRIDL
jgi:hypothetical protein